MKEKLDFIVQREGRRMSDIREEEIPRCLMLSSPEATGHLTFVPLPASSLLRTTFFTWQAGASNPKLGKAFGPSSNFCRNPRPSGTCPEIQGPGFSHSFPSLSHGCLGGLLFASLAPRSQGQPATSTPRHKQTSGVFGPYTIGSTKPVARTAAVSEPVNGVFPGSVKPRVSPGSLQNPGFSRVR